jgi:hypothetical protein
MSQYHAVALMFGYVESSTNSWLIYSTPPWLAPFSTKREMLNSLVDCLYNKYSAELKEINQFHDLYKDHMAKCCRSAWEARDRSNPPERCPTCDAIYSTPSTPKDVFSEADWIKFLYEIKDGTCDSYGDSDCNNPMDWTPWHFKFEISKENMIIITENAEVILSYVLHQLHPELEFDEMDFEYEHLVNDYNKLLEE